MSHKCPSDRCSKQVNGNSLMCGYHWFMIPKSLRDAVWRTWQNGKGMGSQEHLAAMRAAIHSLKGK